MRPEFCEFEEPVAAALSSGQWTHELREHLAHCGQCADMCLVSQYLAGTAARPGEESGPLPAPGLIWWRAQLAERQEQAARAMAAIEIMQNIAIAAALVVVAVLPLFWKPMHWSTLLMGVGLLVSTAAVLYGWVRGRI
jgi:hypothetical protein